MAVVNPSMVNALTGRVIQSTPDIGGSIGQGLQNAQRIQAVQIARQQMDERRRAEQKAADMQRMLSAAKTPEERMNALMSYDPGTAINYQNSQLAVDKFNTESEQRMLDSERRNAFFRTAGMEPEQEAFFSAFPDKAAPEYAKNVFGVGSEPPKTRTRIAGDEQVEEEWTGDGWREIGRGPRWRPDGPGTIIYDSQTGNPIAQIGGAPIGTKAKNDIGSAAFNAANILARLDSIASSYDRRFLEAGTRTWAVTQNMLDKFDAGTASPEEMTFLDDMVGFYTDAFNNLNLTLKELSGAAVNEHEMKRLTQELPTPGELKPATILSGDGPRRFASKLKAAIRRNKLALARYNYFLNTGRIEDFEEMKRNNTLPSLFGEEGRTGVDQLIEKRGQELERIYRDSDPDATADQIATWVSDRLTQEFGLQIGSQ